MNKKKLILTILIDMMVLAILIAAIYLLMFKNLKQWQSNIATVLVVIAFPTIFYSLYTQFATNKYGKLKDEDDKLWEQMIQEENKIEEEQSDNQSAT